MHLVFLSSVQWDSQTRKALRVAVERGGRKISVYVHPVCIYICAYAYIRFKDLTCIPSPFTTFLFPCPHPSPLLFPPLTILLPYNIKHCPMRSLAALPTDRPGDSLHSFRPRSEQVHSFRKWTRQPATLVVTPVQNYNSALETGVKDNTLSRETSHQQEQLNRNPESQPCRHEHVGPSTG